MSASIISNAILPPVQNRADACISGCYLVSVQLGDIQETNEKWSIWKMQRQWRRKPYSVVNMEYRIRVKWHFSQGWVILQRHIGNSAMKCQMKWISIVDQR